MVLNVVDEILDGEPKFNITNNPDGTKNIDLATEVVQEATDLNKNLFDKIENVLSYQIPNLEEESVIETYTNTINVKDNNIIKPKTLEPYTTDDEYIFLMN